MKYNRMIFYPTNVLHGSYDKPGFFEDDNYRLTQVFSTSFIMILLTEHEGFIGSHFLRVIEEELREPVICIDKEDGWKFLSKFDDWEKVYLIIHNGAMSSTTEKNWMTIAHYNQDFTAHLFGKAIEYQIPVKYASSASVYGNQKKNRKIINPLNQYAISKLIIDYYVLDHIDKFKHIQGFRYFNVYGTGEDHKGDQKA